MVLTFCTGCFPYRYTVRPGVKGLVVDGQTKLPVVNATVTLASIVGTGNWTNDVVIWQTNTVAVTNGNQCGTFCIPPKRKWGIYIVPMDVFLSSYEVTIQKTDYTTLKISFLHDPMAAGKNATTNLGNIELNREK